MDSSAFVFLDETGVSTNMVRRYGWGSRGERLVDDAPHGHWFTTTFVAGLREDGVIAPLVLDGPMTGEAFLAYAEQFLAPALRRGDVVVMDNLRVHKVAGVESAITRGRRQRPLPSGLQPDLNSIEKMFAKLKAMLRKAKARTIDELWDEIGRIIKTIRQEECRNYIASTGYACE